MTNKERQLKNKIHRNTYFIWKDYTRDHEEPQIVETEGDRLEIYIEAFETLGYYTFDEFLKDRELEKAGKRQIIKALEEYFDNADISGDPLLIKVVKNGRILYDMGEADEFLQSFEDDE